MKMGWNTGAAPMGTFLKLCILAAASLAHSHDQTLTYDSSMSSIQPIPGFSRHLRFESSGLAAPAPAPAPDAPKEEAPACVAGEAVGKESECLCSETKPDEPGGLFALITGSKGDAPDGSPVSRVCREGSLCRTSLPVSCVPACVWGKPLTKAIGECICGYLSKYEVCQEVGETCDPTTGEIADPKCHPKQCELGKVLTKGEKCTCGVIGNLIDCEGEGMVCKGEKDAPDKLVCREPDADERISSGVTAVTALHGQVSQGMTDAQDSVRDSAQAITNPLTQAQGTSNINADSGAGSQPQGTTSLSPTNLQPQGTTTPSPTNLQPGTMNTNGDTQGATFRRIL